MARVQAAAAKTAGLPLDKVVVQNHLIGGGFGRLGRDRSSFI
jgi:isoquinoline 1-oxidoreductase subunit beta